MSQNVSVSRSYLLLFSEFTSAKIQHFPVFPTHSPQKNCSKHKKKAQSLVNSAPCYSVVKSGHERGLNRLLCRERDSNPHSCNSQGILSPSCLPFHHRGDLSGCKGTKKSEKWKVKSEKFASSASFFTFFPHFTLLPFYFFTFSYRCRNTLRCPYGPVVEAAYFSNPVSPSCPFCNTPPEFMS